MLYIAVKDHVKDHVKRDLKFSNFPNIFVLCYVTEVMLHLEKK